ncbi:hypothetical protein DPMN_113685 [Dreissena polymorpha]|uniref:Uncharacterized protein n=1 Tax=Dreissena polymorpha TaxID=45954 RepID=A0A9D4QR86_DREPO|nr:hypothetical protein DPMN_113685 [Dreissena polymorpha]
MVQDRSIGFPDPQPFPDDPSTFPVSWLEMTLPALARTCRNHMDIESCQETKKS